MLKTNPEKITNAHELLEWVITQLKQANHLYYGHGTTQAQDEAYACIVHVLSLSLDSATPLTEINVPPELVEWTQQLVATRIAQQIPMPYLLKRAWFAGLELYVDERVLIPRSPLAELIQQGFEPWLAERPVKRILDLATGSGCIAIACAYAFEAAFIDASDISEDVLEVARLNVQRHNLGERVALHKSDLFKGLPQQTYDIIVSNPPYVAQNEIDQLPTEYSFEPQLALAGGGDDGLDLVSTMINQAKPYLSPNGLLIVEVGDREAELMARFPTLAFTWHEFTAGGQGVFILEREDL